RVVLVRPAEDGGLGEGGAGAAGALAAAAGEQAGQGGAAGQAAAAPGEGEVDQLPGGPRLPRDGAAVPARPPAGGGGVGVGPRQDLLDSQGRGAVVRHGSAPRGEEAALSLSG